ncbi:MAG: hypothetical protein ABSB83_06300 [Methanomassiliicoccales archaeon]
MLGAREARKAKLMLQDDVITGGRIAALGRIARDVRARYMRRPNQRGVILQGTDEYNRILIQDVEDSVQGALAEELDSCEISPILNGAMRIIAECSEKDPAGAGHVALSLAQYLSDLKSCESKIEERLKSLANMMRSTRMVFAPIVLGIKSSLVGIISDYGVSASDLLSETILMVGLYIVELAAVVSYFNVFLSGDRNWKEVGYEFGELSPSRLGDLHFNFSTLPVWPDSPSVILKSSVGGAM